MTMRETSINDYVFFGFFLLAEHMNKWCELSTMGYISVLMRRLAMCTKRLSMANNNSW